MKDRLYLVLAFLGFVILGIVVIKNYNPSQVTRQYEIDAFYSPNNSVNSAESLDDLYNEMAGKRKLACPQTVLKTSRNVLSLTPLYGSNINKSSYDMNYMFVEYTLTEPIKLSQVVTYVDKESLASTLGLSLDAMTSKEEVKLSDLLMFSENTGSDKILKLVAPFNFTFGNTNVENSNRIIICNSNDSVEITFTNTKNWFCAGEPDATESSNKDWDSHHSNHLTLIGNTQNASINKGVAGSVIGYGTPNTSISIKAKDSGGSWSSISIYDLLTEVE